MRGIALIGGSLNAAKAALAFSAVSAWGFVIALLLAAAAQADPLAEAQAAYAEGRFLEAAELAQAVNSAESYVLASECLERHATFRAQGADRQALYERAAQLGEQAIGLDGSNALAHLQAAQALGLYAETLGPLRAGGHVRKVREGMEKALELDPNLAEAIYSLGSWHAGVVIGAGGLIARITHGATARKAIAYYDQALERAPDMKEGLYEAAHRLLAINPKRHRQRAREWLNRAIAVPPKNAVDRILHQKAVERLAELDG